MAATTLLTETLAGSAVTNTATSAPAIDLQYPRDQVDRGEIFLKMKNSNKITQEILARRLLYLPVDLGEKVLMWLTYKELKPVSEITVIKRNLSKLRKGIRTNDYDFNSPKSKRIRKWLKDAGLFRVSESKYPGSWHIGKNLSEVKLSVKVIRKFDYENEILSGKIFGFPPGSVVAYAINRSLEASDPKHPVLWPGDRFQNPYLKDKYFTPYIRYALDANRIKEDSEIAKIWADTIRKDVPTLAKWYEKRSN